MPLSDYFPFFTSNDTKKKVWYARVSSKPQENSLEDQVKVFENHGAKKEDIIKHVLSAFKDDNFAAIPKDADIIYVTTLDRLTRNNVNLEKFKQNMLKEIVEVIVLEDQGFNFVLSKSRRIPHHAYDKIMMFYNEEKVNSERQKLRFKRARETWENEDRLYVGLIDYIRSMDYYNLNEIQDDLFRNKKIRLSLKKISFLRKKETDTEQAFLVPCNLCRKLRSVRPNVYNNISDDFTCNFLNACSCDTPNLGVEEREEDITTTLRNIQLDEEANTGKFYIIKRLVNRYIDESGEIWYTLIWKHGRKVYHEKRSHLMKYVPQMILNYESFHGY